MIRDYDAAVWNADKVKKRAVELLLIITELSETSPSREVTVALLMDAFVDAETELNKSITELKKSARRRPARTNP